MKLKRFSLIYLRVGVIITLVLLTIIPVFSQDMIINLQANDLVYSNNNNKIYAIVSSYSLYYPSYLVEMNPYTGNVEDSCLLIGNPMRIKLTNDEKFAYISYNDTSYVTRINIDFMQIDKRIGLDTINANDHLYCYDFDILSSSNNDIVVCRSDYIYGGGSFVDLVLYRDGVEQPKKIEKWMSDSSSTFIVTIEQVTSNTTGELLYGYNSKSTGFESYIIKVEDDGLILLSKYGALIDMHAKIKIHNDTVFTRNGRILTPFNTEVPTLIATCPVASLPMYYEKYGFAYSSYHNSYVFPYDDYNNFYLRFFDSKTFVFKEAIFIDIPKEISGNRRYLLQIEEINSGRFAILMTDYSEYYFIYLAGIEKSNIAFLSNLSISDSGLSNSDLFPEFDPFNFSYEIELPESWWLQTPEIKYETAHPLATVEIERPFGVPSQAKIKVTAEDGVTTNTYYINYIIAD